MCYQKCVYEDKEGLCTIMPYPNAPADADCADDPDIVHPVDDPFIDAPLEEPFSMRGFTNSLLAGQHG